MHYLPSWYNILEKNTAKSVWSEGIPDVPQQKLFLNKFNHKPLIVKDYVKSRKHEWEEACFIPDSSDAPQALKVIRTFIDRQGVDLVGGIVLREYIPLRIIDHHKKSGMPIANEARIFYYYQKAFAAIKYWSGEQVPNYHEYDFLNKVCDCLDSNFFTIDIAQKVNGEWFIIEAGDGQVSGLQNFAPALFYDGLLKTAFFEHKKAEQ